MLPSSTSVDQRTPEALATSWEWNITVEAPGWLDHDQLPVAPVHAGERLKRFQLADHLAVVLPAANVLRFGAPRLHLLDEALEHPSVEANDESVHPALLQQRLVVEPS